MNTINYLLILLIICGFNIFNYRDENNLSSNNNANVLMPLKIGNYWIYKITYYENPESMKSIEIDTISIIGDTIIKNEKYYKILYKGYTDVLMVNKNDGLYVKIISNVILTLRFLRYPVNPNTNYTGYIYLKIEEYNEDIDKTYSFAMNVETLNENVKVQAGTFKCIKYISPDFDIDYKGKIYIEWDSTHIFLAPNIGIIKTISQSKKKIDYIKSLCELIEYKIN